MEVVAGIIGQCGSKSDAKRQGEREKGIKTRKWRPVTKSGDSDDKVATLKVQTLNTCLLWAAGVLEVVAGIIGECGRKSDAKRPGECEKMLFAPDWPRRSCLFAASSNLSENSPQTASRGGPWQCPSGATELS